MVKNIDRKVNLGKMELKTEDIFIILYKYSNS